MRNVKKDFHYRGHTNENKRSDLEKQNGKNKKQRWKKRVYQNKEWKE